MKIKGTKKLLLVLMALVCTLAVGFAAAGIFSALSPVTAFAAEEEIAILDQSGDFTYDSSDSAKLTGLSDAGKQNAGNKNIKIVIPSGVSAIADQESEYGLLGQSYANKLVELDLGSVTSIGKNAFRRESSFNGKDALAVLTIPAGVTSIGNNAFANRTGLTAINFYATECVDFSANVNENPFYRAGGYSGNTSLNVVIGGTGSQVTRIPANMFLTNISASNNKVTSVNFANVNIEAGRFGANAFSGCANLKSVDITGSSVIEKIGVSAFKNCASLVGSTKPNDDGTTGYTAIALNVNEIGAEAFSGCRALKDVTFGNNLTKIDNNAFSGCSALADVSFPESSLKFIGDSAFQGCTSFKAITVPYSVTTLGTNAFYGCTGATTINYYAQAAVPTNTNTTTSPFANGANNVTLNIGGTNAVTNLYSYLFRSTQQSQVKIKVANFNNVNIGNASAFGNSLFAGCTTLTTVNFTSDCNVIGIAGNAFYGCTSLSSITIPDSVTYIGKDAFNGCSALYTINIPSKIDEETDIGKDAFAGCNRLIEVYDGTKLGIAALTANDKTKFGGIAANAKNIYTDKANGSNITESGDYIFYQDKENNSENYLITYIGTSPRLTLPEGTYGIYSQAFKGNEKITSVDASNANLTTIESEAFSGCTSLYEVILSGNGSSSLSYIRSAAFKGCRALTSIVIPYSVTTIETEAFDGCISLSNVTFTEKTVAGANEAKFSLTAIQAYAFRNCSSLSVIKIPVTVTSLGDSAFEGCASLKTVYLPSALDSRTFGNNVFNRTNGMVLIAPNKTVYETYATNTLADYESYLTYEVAISLCYQCHDHNGVTHGASGENLHVEYRLFKGDYRLVKQEDGSWAVGELFAQHGYESSVWYSGYLNNDYVNEITSAWWSTALGANSKAIDDNGLITVYAKTTPKITLTANTTLEYNDGNTQTLGVEDLLTNYASIDLSKYNVEIIGYAPYYTPDKVTTNIPQSDAGHYIVAANLAEGLGKWAEPVTVTVTVAPMTAINSFWSSWVQVDGTAYGTELDKKDELTTLFIHQTGEKEVPFLERQAEGDTAVNVQASYLSYTGNSVMIALKGDATYFPSATEGKYYKVTGSYSDQTGSASGVYTTSVDIAAENNYRFSIAQVGAGDNVWANYGVTVEHKSGTNVYTITKTWYIAVNSMNTPLFGNSTTLEPTGWEYNKTVPGKPEVANYDTSKDKDVALNELISFSLMKNVDTSRAEEAGAAGTVTIAQDGTPYAQYGNYVNKYMPAGTYTLRITVAEYTDTNGKIYVGSTYSYPFTIDYGSNDLTADVAKLNAAVGERAYAQAYDGENLFFGNVKDLLNVFSFKEDDLHGSKADRRANGGYWGREENDYLYTGYNIMYDIVAGRIEGNNVNYASSSGKFLTEEDYAANYDNKVQALPLNIGYYRVYYYIYAPSYNCTVGTNYYNIRIYGEVKNSDLPTITPVAFAGQSVVPLVNDKNGWFTVHWLDENVQDYSYEAVKWTGTDSYIFAGTHYLALTINETYSRLGVLEWSDEIQTVSNDNGNVLYAKVPFEITPAQNVSDSLTFNNWNWGQYDAKNNRPVWNTRYGDYDIYTFTLISKDADRKVYTYGDERNGFDKADAGAYTLRAYAAGNTWNNMVVTGYNWYELTVEIDVTILPGNISWTTAPYIISWKYGEFMNRSPMSEGVMDSAYGNLLQEMEVYYCKVENLNNPLPSQKKASLTDFVNAEGEVPAGDYALVYSLKGTVNYDEWVYPVLFSVIKADNHWAKTPTITGWYYGDSSIDYETYKPDYALVVGDKSLVKIEYCVLDENEVEIGAYKSSLAEVGLDSKGHLPVGHYKLKATVPATENYASMEFTMNFVVSKAQNSWKDIPSVVSWQEGRWTADKNGFVAEDLYGSTVRISIIDSNNNTIIEKERIDEINVNVLKKLGVGAYTLIAYVDETYDHEGLESVASFAVLEDSVGMTGLIAATSVFAVIAVGLAAAATVLLIRRNKKIEEEFRKMVKSELNRR